MRNAITGPTIVLWIIWLLIAFVNFLLAFNLKYAGQGGWVIWVQLAPLPVLLLVCGLPVVVHRLRGARASSLTSGALIALTVLAGYAWFFFLLKAIFFST